MAKSRDSSRIDIGDKENLSAISGLDGEKSTDDVEILGSATWFTIGDLVIPREWLKNRMTELGIDHMTPGKRRTDSAFRAAARWLVQPEHSRGSVAESFEIRKDGRNRRHLIAQLYQAPGEDEDEGEWHDETLGVFEYDSGDEGEHASVHSHQRIADDSPLAGDYEMFEARMRQLFAEMQESHGGDSIHDMIYDWITRRATVIKLRDAGAVYFVPSQYSDTIEALSTLCADLNQFKDRGRQIEMFTLPIVDDEKRREMVATRAQVALSDRLEDVVDEALEMVEDELDIDEAVEAVAEDLEQSGEFAEQYNQLLEVEMTLSETLESWVESASDAQSEIAGKIAEELEDGDATTDGGTERDEHGRFK